MPHLPDASIARLLVLSDRLGDRVRDWFDSSEDSDISAKVPDERIRKCLELNAKIVMDVARLDAEHAKNTRRNGQQPLTDEEYERDIRLIGLDVLRELDDAAIAAELERRGLSS